MSLTYEEFKKELEKDEAAGKTYLNELTCPKCKGPMERHPDEPGPTLVVEGKRVEVCDDCYYGEWGEELEKHPIITPRPSRGG